jgi:hypothetical protein
LSRFIARRVAIMVVGVLLVLAAIDTSLLRLARSIGDLHLAVLSKSKPAGRTLDAFVVASRSFVPEGVAGHKEQERPRDERGTIEEKGGVFRRRH